jgi:hypothetical protein
MSLNIRTGNSTRIIQKIQSQLVLGRYQLENYRKESSKSPDMSTYYLLDSGIVVKFRIWHQMNRPNYLVTGSKAGCEAHWKRHHHHSQSN